MKKFKKLINSINFRFIFIIIFILLLSNAVACIIGYVEINDAMKRTYYEYALNVSNTANDFLDGDKLNDYLSDVEKYKNDAEYLETVDDLDHLCQEQKITLLYVIVVDKESNYDNFYSVFNAVSENNPYGYTPWELGYHRNSTDEYIDIYKNIYEKKMENGVVVRTKNLNGKPPHITAISPVYDSSGEVVALTCVQREMNELNSLLTNFVQKNTLTSFLNLILFVFLGIIYCIKQFSNPVKKIIDESKRFSKTNTVDESNNKSISRITEINSIWKSLHHLETDVVNNANSLEKLTKERERISTELNLAKKIQMTMIPSVFPPFPERNDMDLFGLMSPAKEVGGDYFDFYLLDDDHLALTIGDVSGKGVPAALFMMVTKILTSNLASLINDPAKILEALNDKISANNQEDMFVTVWFGILCLSTGKIICANAGHEDPIIISKEGKAHVYETKHGLAIGCFPNMKYKNYEFTLEKNETLLVYTDGVTEAINDKNVQFGIQGIIDVIDKELKSNTNELIKEIKSSIDEFSAKTPQFDDITMLAIKRI